MKVGDRVRVVELEGSTDEELLGGYHVGDQGVILEVDGNDQLLPYLVGLETCAEAEWFNEAELELCSS